MGCESCSNNKNGQPKGCRNNGTCSTGGCSKLAVFDWLANMELPAGVEPFEYVEVRFKNSRKEFYNNRDQYSLNPGDVIVVEGSPGFDVGVVSASGELARLQFQKKSGRKSRDIKKILRKAGSHDLEKWREAKALEYDTMHQARTIANSLGLEMKISDVEYQGDKTKAIFYYTAEGRVDFRELIKKYADAFRIRVEMKQIGARQEAGRLGGIGSCGRELCCSTWLTDFRSVSTSAARYQQLALNTQKLAGQCGKLKCCLNYELDSYLDALKGFPKNSKIKTKKGTAQHLKTDIFKGIMWYVYEDSKGGSPVALQKERVKEILELNEKGKYPEDLRMFAIEEPSANKEAFTNVVGQDSLTRFDKKKKKKSPRKGRRKQRKPQSDGNKQRQNQPRSKKGKGRNSSKKPRNNKK